LTLALTSILLKPKKIVIEIKSSKNKLMKYNCEWEKYINEEKEKDNLITKVSLTINCQTRWYSLKKMLYKLQKSKKVLERLSLNDDSEISNKTKRIIKDDEFWEKLENISAFITPIIEGNSELSE
jgi:hypothetical protein